MIDLSTELKKIDPKFELVSKQETSSDPLTRAKQKIVKSISQQIHCIDLLLDGKEWPYKETQSQSTGKAIKRNSPVKWIAEAGSNYRCNIRYGRDSIAHLFFSKAKGRDVVPQVSSLQSAKELYQKVIKAIEDGDVDSDILKLQQSLAAAMTTNLRGKKK